MLCVCLVLFRKYIARPAGVHYNHCVSHFVCPSLRGQLVKILITLEPHFDHILHTYACQHCLSTSMCYSFFDRRGFAEHQSWSVSENAHNIVQLLVSKTVTRLRRASVCLSLRGYLVKMLIILEPHCIF